MALIYKKRTHQTEISPVFCHILKEFNDFLIEMASRCLANFKKYCSMRRFLVFSGTLNQSPITGQYITRVPTLSLKCFNLDPTTNVGHARLIHSTCYLTAGHSKWHNIKHIKEACDRERGVKSTQLSRKLQVLFDRNPETDPRLNTELANLIKWARTNNLTNDVINKAIDRQIKQKDPKCITAFGGRGPSNTGIIIECFSPKPQHTKCLLQSVVKKFGFNLNASVDDLFDHKGVLDVELPKEDEASAMANPEAFSVDKYIEVAINAGAEEVTLENDGERPYLQFTCGPLDVPRVSKVLTEAGLEVVSSERTYIPKIVVPVTEEYLESLKKLIDKLEVNADVVKYHFNVEPES